MYSDSAEQENPLNTVYSYLLYHICAACSGAMIQSAKRKSYCQAAMVYILLRGEYY